MSLGGQIKHYRNLIDKKQAVLASEMDVSTQAVSSWENDDSLPDTDKLVKLAKCLNTTVGRLLEEHEIPDWKYRNKFFDPEHMFTFLKSTATSRGLEQTRKVLTFARDKHEGQYRKNVFKNVPPNPYIIHPLTMACQAVSLGLYDDILISALLLHDVVEDTNTLLPELPVNDEVKKIVELVSKKRGYDKQKDAPDYYEKISGNPYACMVKVIDRINNLADMAHAYDCKKMVTYVSETEEYIVPLLKVIKDYSAEFNNAAWNLTYQMYSLLETYKNLI